MLVTRLPPPALRPYVRRLWATGPRIGEPSALLRQHVLPTVDMHLAFRLGGPAVRLFDGSADQQGTSLGHAVVGGARTAFYIKEGGSSGSVGALLAPGGALALLDAPADVMAGRHALLQDFWGGAANRALDLLQEADDPELQLDLFECLLMQRLRKPKQLHPAVMHALRQLGSGASMADAVRATGYSHRHVLTLFRESTGLAPKQYAGVLRLQSLLDAALKPGNPGWAQLSQQAGFSDQSHFTRAFGTFAGMTPQAWRRAAPRHAHHVPMRQA